MKVDIKDFNHLNLHKITKPLRIYIRIKPKSFHKTHFNSVDT